MRLTFFKSMKTHVEKMSVFRLSIMLMKTQELNRYLHYVDEKKGEGSWTGNRSKQTEEGGLDGVGKTSA